MGAQGREKPIDELRPLADWFAGALEHEGFDGVAHFIASDDYFGTKRAKIYRLAAAEGTIDKPLMRLIALTLNDAETGLWLWEKAWEALQVSAAKEARESERIDSWTLIPHILDPDVERLLQAQRQEARLLPYRELAVKAPALTTIYVRQRVQARMDAPPPPPAPSPQDRPRRFREKKPPTTAVESTSAFDALNRSPHLLLTGEAGSGKTTFSYYTTELLSRIWLGDLSPRDCAVQAPVMPLRVLARHLTGGRPWDEELAEAVRKTLGSRLLSGFSPELLRGRVHGVRWLVFVDGLDEITDAEARRELIGTLAHHARVSEQYRFVIGTRMLESAEIAPLRGESVGAYEMVPFRREDLETFAANWFSAQNLSHTDDHWRAHADRYLREVQDSRLRELVRNPLLATIAAVVSTRDPGKPLPTNRLDLYRTVVRYLIDDAYSGRRYEARSELDVWLHKQRERLIECLGRARIEDEPLLASAAAWIAENWTGSGEQEDFVRAARRQLTATGLFVQDDEDVRFLHHSFAEYLSGLGFAAAIGPDADALASWVEVNKDRDENLLLFTVLSWHRLHGGNLAPLLADYRRHQLVVHLIGEGLDLGDDVTAMVVDKAIQYSLPRSLNSLDPLGRMYGNPIAAERLRRLADHRELPADVRADALLTLGRITSFDSVATELIDMLPTLSADSRITVAKAVAEDLPGRDSSQAIEILRACVEEAVASVDANSLVQALTQLCEIGATEVADRLLDTAAATIVSPTAYLEELAVLTARLRGRAGLEQLVERPANAWSRSFLVDGLAETGQEDLTSRLAEGICADPMADEDDVTRACSSWAKAGGDPEAIERAVVARTGLSPRARAKVAEALHKAGAFTQASRLVADTTVLPLMASAEISKILAIWVDARGSRPETFTDLLTRYSEDHRIVAALAGVALSYGHNELARDFAHRAASGTDDGAFVDAIEVLAGLGAPDEAGALARARWESLAANDRLRLARALSADDRDLATTIAVSVNPAGVSDFDLYEAMKHLRIPLSDMPERSRRAVVLNRYELGWHYQERDGYLACLPELIADPETWNREVTGMAARYLERDLRDPAIAVLRDFLSTDLTPEARAKASAMLAFLSFARPGTKTCGVPGCPGDPAVPTSQEG